MSHLGAVGRVYRPEESISLRGGRLTVGLPSGVQVQLRANPSLMRVQPSAQVEDRALWDRGGELLVLFVTETFATVPDDLRGTVDATLGGARTGALGARRDHDVDRHRAVSASWGLRGERVLGIAR